MTSTPATLRRHLLGRSPKWTLIRALVLGLATWFICTSVIRPCRVQGRSMEPTFADGSLNAITLLRYRSTPPARGDIVAARMTSLDNRHFYLKRVLGLPGEQVAFQDGALLINGKRIPEPYVVHQGTWTTKPLELEEHEFFIIGDNRAMAYDLHLGGAIHRNHIVGGLLRP